MPWTITYWVQGQLEVTAGQEILENNWVPNWLHEAPELLRPGEAAPVQLGKAELAAEAYETVCFVWLLATVKKSATKERAKDMDYWRGRKA